MFYKGFRKLNQQIAHIAFYDSVIVVEKFMQPVTKKFDVLKSHGQIFVRDYPEALTCDESFKLKKRYR